MKKTKRNFIIIAIVVMVIVAIFAIFTSIYFATHKQDKGHASIELSASIDRIYLGGSGEISAILRYSGDGSVENSDFTYESDNPDLLSFAQVNGKYTGEYWVKAKDNDEDFDDVKVTVTVRCVNNADIEPSDIEITVTDAQVLSIHFYKNVEDKNPTDEINIYQGYSIDKINQVQHTSLGIPNYSPSDDFDVEWYDKYSGQLVDINAQSTFYGCSELELYARYHLNKSIQFIDELNKSNVPFVTTSQIYYGEKIEDTALMLKMQEQLDSVDGWSFDGWVPNINDSTSENSFKVGLAEGRFVSSNSTLYAKWTGNISFEVPLAEGATESLGVAKVANITTNSISVIYGGNLGGLPSVEYAYPDGLSDKGWYTEKFGSGASLDSYIQNGRYIGAANQTYYNKTEIEIIFHDELTGNSVSRSVIYGTSFTEAFPRFTKTGWTLETNWDVAEIGEVSEDFIKEFCYNLNKTTTCNAIWNITIQYNADLGKIAGVYNEDEIDYTVRYGQTLDLDQPNNQGSWRFSGWYDNENLSGEAVERQSTKSEGFVDFVSNHITQIGGKYYLRLYAKWINEVSLNYGDDYRTPTEFPTTLQLVYGKTVSSSKNGQWLPSLSDISGSNNENVPNGYDRGVSWYADKNKENSETIVDGTTYYYPLSMDVLYFKWEGKSYTITLKYTDITSTTWTIGTVENVQYDKEMPQIPSSYKPSVNLPEAAFLGYFYGTEAYYDSDLGSVRKWNITEDDVTLYAQFGTEYTVTLDFNGGSGGTGSVKTAYGQYLKTVIAPTRIGYTFTGYYDSKTDQSTTNQYYNSNMGAAKKWDKTSNATLYAGWEAIPLNDITTSNNNNDDLLSIGSSEAKYIQISGGSGYYYYTWTIIEGSGVSALFETSSSATSPTTVTKNKLTVKKSDDNAKGKIRVTVTDYYTGLYKTIDFDFSTNCFAEGTRILMADGSYKNIEDIKVGDIVMSWNFVTGQLEAMPVALYWYHGTSVCTVLNLAFSDNTVLRIIGTHGLFDYDLNKYVYLTAENYMEYMGHSFVIYDVIQGYNRITLTNAYVTSEKVGSYSLRTACNDNAFAEGLLSLTAEDFPGYLTYFEIGENMKYDEEKMQADIELYGLFTYEDWLNDWSEYITYEEFIAFNGQYFKILIGKGILSYEDIFSLINGLRNGFDIQS